MVFRPPPPAPFAGPSNPPRVSATVDASPSWWQNNSQNAGVAAGAVVDSYGGEIRQFVAQQRLNYAAGIVPINRQPMSPGPDLDVFYMNQQGQENIHYLVRSESSVVGGPSSTTPPPTPPTPPTPLTEGEQLLALTTIAVVFFDGAT